MMPRSVRITLIFILVNALVWLVFALLVATGLHPSLPASIPLRWFMVAMSLIAAVALTGVTILLKRRNKLAHLLSVAGLGLLVILTVVDEVGLVDLLVLVAEVLPLVLLIKDRRWYWGKE
jgi:hypothetical protein